MPCKIVERNRDSVRILQDSPHYAKLSIYANTTTLNSKAKAGAVGRWLRIRTLGRRRCPLSGGRLEDAGGAAPSDAPPSGAAASDSEAGGAAAGDSEAGGAAAGNSDAGGAAPSDAPPSTPTSRKQYRKQRGELERWCERGGRRWQG